MPNLLQSLLNRDLGHLRIVAQFWGIKLAAGERKAALKELSERLIDAELLAELLETLPDDAQNAIQALAQNQGKVAWAAFERKFGKVREAGPGKRDREQLHLKPISAAEILFYRALVARAFFETENGAQEFAYIPDDLLKIIHHEGHEEHEEKQKIFGRLARPEERAHIIPANDHILDDLTTLLAALRTGQDESAYTLETAPRFARDLSLAARLIGKGGNLQRDTVKAHLELNRLKAFAQLREIWRVSESFNELQQVPSIICEGEWINPVIETRNTLLGFVDALPKGKWWNLNSFIADIKTEHPDIQRTAGDYDAWFIRAAEENGLQSLQTLAAETQSQETLESVQSNSLCGFEHWDEVEGALIRYFMTGVLFWLGFVDLAASEEGRDVKAFLVKENPAPERSERQGAQTKDGANKSRSSSAGFTSVQPSAQRLVEDGKIIVSSNGLITVERHAPRVVRYQLARFGEWITSKNPNEFKYQITTSSLEKALTQGLKVTHLVVLLAKHSETKIPPSLGKALRRWEVNGTEARVRQVTILRLSKPEDLEALRKSRAGRFLGAVLNPTTVEIGEGASQKVMAALIEMGILMESEDASHQV